MKRQVFCPHCRQVTAYESNPHRPFCSERCRLLDLGAWASGQYRVPGESVDSSDLQQRDGVLEDVSEEANKPID